MPSFKFWENPNYERTTKRTDNKRRIKLIRSYAPDWFVRHINFILLFILMHFCLCAGLLQFFWRTVSLVHQIMSFADHKVYDRILFFALDGVHGFRREFSVHDET
jgi:diacylglycerol diphosphate phosphatase/phosphatidate phosphatase